MKLIISDYDQTINFRGEVKDQDRKAISEFINQGNVFAISSSRNYESLNADINAHGLPYSFLCCNNGNAIFSQNELLYTNSFNTNELLLVNQFIPNLPNNTLIYPCSARGSIDLIQPVFIKIYLPENENFENYIAQFMENGIDTDYYKNYGLLFSKSRDKKFAAQYLGELCDISKNDIYAIGDGDNDFSMLQCFNGYSFPWRSDMIRSLNIPIVDSVANMIGDIQKVRKNVIEKVN